jgi:hypothetical protein
MTLQDSIDELRELWGLLFESEPSPPGKQFALWLARFGAEITKQGLAQAAIKRQNSQNMSSDHIYRFATAAMNRLNEERIAA